MGASDKWTSPLFALFFVISGAELELNVFTDIAIVFIGVVYIVFRCVGKYLGAGLSARAMKCGPNVYKYLGITLFPQAGVALGMCTTAMELGDQGNLIRNIILFAVLIYELVGPLLTRQALMTAGEIYPIPEHVLNRRKHKLEQAKEMQK
jgi:Kef-type K+ transport system membrane component KefB